MTCRFHSFFETNVLAHPYDAKLHMKIRGVPLSPLLALDTPFRRRLRPGAEVGRCSVDLRTRVLEGVRPLDRCDGRGKTVGSVGRGEYH